MKRSRVNEIIIEAIEIISSYGFHLPKFAYWSPNDFVSQKNIAKKIISARYGWDITDFGKNDFNNTGLALFTLRNGHLSNLKNGKGMCYAEKLLLSKKNQVTPLHTHISKVEDIINRNGADLIVKLYGSTETGILDPNKGGKIFLDGIPYNFSPGEKIKLNPGESVTLLPGDWHSFWAEKGNVLIGEVSTVNDDENDNIFHDPVGRFAKIEENENPLHLLVSDYHTWISPSEEQEIL